MNKTTTAYIRCSTHEQDAASQAQQIDDWCRQEGRAYQATITDTASGSVQWQRRQLGPLVYRLQHGDSIIVSEISRIARSTLGVLSFLQVAADRGIEVHAVRNKLALDGSLPSKITVTVLALAAEIERDLLRERTRAALDARRLAGLPLGRPRGSRSPSVLTSRTTEIVRLLNAGVSKRAIARVLACAPGTLYAHLADIDARKQEEK